MIQWHGMVGDTYQRWWPRSPRRAQSRHTRPLVADLARPGDPPQRCHRLWNLDRAGSCLPTPHLLSGVQGLRGESD